MVLHIAKFWQNIPLIIIVVVLLNISRYNQLDCCIYFKMHHNKVSYFCKDIIKINYSFLLRYIPLVFWIYVTIKLQNTDMRRERPTTCYTIVYWTYNSLNMFRAPLCPSSGAWDYKNIHSMWHINLVMVVEQHPSTLMHNLQPHATPTTNHNQSYVSHAMNICIVSSSWWWA